MKRRLFLIIAVLMVVSLACSFFKPKADPAPEEPVATQDLGTGDDNDNVDTPSDDDDGSSASEDDGALSIDDDAFSQLDYYRIALVMVNETGDDPVEETTIESAYTRDPAAKHITMSANDENIEIIQIEDQMWMRFGDQWIQTSADESSDMTAGFGDFLSGMQDMADLENSDYKYQGKENIDGIQTRHYTGKYKAPWLSTFLTSGAQTEFDEGTIEFWVADERDLPRFVIKTEMVVEGTVDDKAAKFTMTQIATDINKPFTIEPPSQEEVGGLPEDIPLYPDATEVTTFGGMTVFSSADSIEDVAEFYNNALEQAGWEQTDNMEIEGMITSSWQKDAETLQLTVSLGDNDSGSSVMIIIGEE